MYARSTTIEAQPSAIDAGIAHVRESVLPALSALDGCVGLSLLVDRESCRCIATSAWVTSDALQSGASAAQSIRDGAVAAFAGTATVDEWEIAVLHRDHHSGAGACVRATWFRLPNGRGTVELYRDTVLPALQRLEGFCSASLMINRSRAVSSVTFDSREAMDHNREQARSLRTARLRELGADQIDVGEFTLEVAHLRVPELI